MEVALFGTSMETSIRECLRRIRCTGEDATNTQMGMSMKANLKKTEWKELARSQLYNTTDMKENSEMASSKEGVYISTSKEINMKVNGKLESNREKEFIHGATGRLIKESSKTTFRTERECSN